MLKGKQKERPKRSTLQAFKNRNTKVFRVNYTTCTNSTQTIQKLCKLHFFDKGGLYLTFTDFTDEELRAAHNEYMNRWRANHPDKNAEYCRRYRAKKKAAEQADRAPDTDATRVAVDNETK